MSESSIMTGPLMGLAVRGTVALPPQGTRVRAAGYSRRLLMPTPWRTDSMLRTTSRRVPRTRWTSAFANRTDQKVNRLSGDQS